MLTLEDLALEEITERGGPAVLEIDSPVPGRMIPPAIGLPLRNLALAPFSRPIKEPQLDPALRERLLELFREDAERLRCLTGMRFDGWCV